MTEPDEQERQTPGGALLEGSVTSALRKMSVPMLLGMVAMIMVNLIDTYWVSRLGTDALAAMSFTFPVASLVINISLGLLVGTSVAVSRSVGAGRPEEARRLTTDATILALAIVLMVSGLGLIFQDPLFRLLGAKGQVLEDVKAYMTPWFIGVAFLVVPMIANGSIRGLGDAKTPMRVMMMGAAINAVLDPIFIFGWGPVPAMGLQGAAIATVIARMLGMVFVFYILVYQKKLLDLRGITKSGLWTSWKRVGRVAIPAIITNAVGPLSIGVLTGMVAAHGPNALAAWGIGARVDAVLLLVPFALSGAISPFVGQNWGAHLQARVSDGLRKSLIFAVIWGTTAAAVCMVSAPLLGALFSSDPAVQNKIVGYLQVVPVGYAFVGTVAICSSAFNAVDRATRSSVLSILRSLALAIPAAMIGDQIAGMHGLLLGLVSASILSALTGVFWMKSLLFPYGEAPAGAGKALQTADVLQWLRDNPCWTTFESNMDNLMQLDSMRIHPVGKHQLGFYVGAIELGHLESKGVLDIPLPVEVGDNLVRRGVLNPHPDLDDNGWYRFTHKSVEQNNTAEWLVGLSHLLYELSERGEADPITQAEMDAYTESPQCVTAMRAAAARWKALPATP